MTMKIHEHMIQEPSPDVWADAEFCRGYEEYCETEREELDNENN